MAYLFAMPEYDPTVGAQFNLVMAQPAHGLWIDAMLFVQHTRGKCPLIVVAQHRHGGLDDDRAVVEVCGDEMHRAAMDPHAVLQGTRMGVEAAVGGQQRRMDVYQPAAIARHEVYGEDAHETCQHYKIWMESIDEIGQRGIEAATIRIVAVFDDGSRNAVRLRNSQTSGIRAVTDHRRDTAGQSRFQQC